MSLDYQNQNSILTLEQGLQEFYEINPSFRELAERGSQKMVFKEHDYAHVLFGLGVSIEEESLLDTYTLWGTRFSFSKIWHYAKSPEGKEITRVVLSKYGGWWSVIKIVFSLIPVKIMVIKRCLRMKKRWHYHDIKAEDLNKPLYQLREEYNIHLLSIKEIPVDRYINSQA